VVTDFGIARAVSEAGGDRLTETGIAVGTPAYMSPEQAAGSSEVDQRSDEYALACVVYEMLAGEPPFTGPTAESILRQQLTAEPPDINTVRSGVGRDVAGALRRGLAKAAADRYGTASQFIDDLTTTTATAGRKLRPAVFAAGTVLGLIAAGWLVTLALSAGGNGASDLPRLVVLPFENLGPPEDAFFADGMTEEITSRLSHLPGVGIIGRTSAMQYKGGDKPVRIVGAELGVDYVLEGTVRWGRGEAESRVRITTQLIRVADETHVWAEQYDAVLADVFAVQGRIAGQVISALGLALRPSEVGTEVAVPTRNLVAYEQYLLGNALYAQCATVPCTQAREAEQHFEEAVRLDPQFAAAWARITLAWSWSWSAPPTDRRRAEEAAAQALELAPDLPDAHVAIGRLAYAPPNRDYRRAEEAYRRALELDPNHVEALRGLGLVYRRRGDMVAAADVLRRHADLDPRDGRALYDVGVTYQRLRRYDEAERFLKRYHAPGGSAHARLAILHLMRDGNVSAAQEVLAARPTFWPLVSVSGGTALGFVDLGEILCADCAPAARSWLTEAGPVPPDSSGLSGPYASRGIAARLAGKEVLARAYLDSAVQRAEADTTVGPRDFGFYRNLARWSAWLGRKEAAIRAAREAVRIVQSSGDATWGPDAVTTAAEVYAMFGEDEAALEHLEMVLSTPSHVSVPLVRVNPVWQRFKSDPRFQALLAKYEN
jgi:serine/threonine-protein kinase